MTLIPGSVLNSKLIRVGVATGCGFVVDCVEKSEIALPSIDHRYLIK